MHFSGILTQSSPSRTTLPWKMGLTGCPEMSVWNYQSTLCQMPEEQKSHVTNRSEQHQTWTVPLEWCNQHKWLTVI